MSNPFVSNNDLWSSPAMRRRGSGGPSASSYYGEQEARLSWGIDQAVSRGILTQEQAEAAKSGNDRTLLDRLLNFNESSKNLLGTWGQGIVDVLSLGNYATAAASKAAIYDPLVEIGGLRLGFTPQEFYKQWRDRPTFSDMTGDGVGGFTAGLALDVAMDPTTWLTFGISSGVKVAARGITKVGAKEVGEGMLTLTRHGQEVYRMAANRMRPEIQKRLMGKTPGMGEQELAAATMLELHEDIAKYMVKNYDVLAQDLVAKDGAWQEFKSVFGKKQTQENLLASTGMNRFGQTAEDMFFETAKAAQRDRGIDFGYVARSAKTSPLVGKVWTSIARNFNRRHGVAADIQEQWFVTKGTIERQIADKATEVNEALGSLDRSQLQLVTSILEGGDGMVSSHYDKAQQTMINVLAADGTMIDPKVMDAVDFARKRFEDIAAREYDAGMPVNSAHDYVTKYYKTPQASKVIKTHMDRVSGVSNFSNEGGFQMHRAIAVLEDIGQAIGDNPGVRDMNIGSIVSKREAASIRMIEMEKFYNYIKETAGISTSLVFQAEREGARTSAMLKKIIAGQRPAQSRIYEFDEVFGLEDAYYKRLGFRTDDMGQQKNIATLRALAVPLEERIGSEAVKGLNINNDALMAKRFNPVIKFDHDEIDVTNVLSAIVDPNESILLSPAQLISNIRYDGQVKAVQPREITSLFRKIDNTVRKQLGAPALTLFPGLEASLKAEMHRIGKTKQRGKGLLADAQKQIDDLIVEMKRPIETKLNFKPKLPKSFIDRAKMARLRYGDYTDVTSATERQVNLIKTLSAKLGMSDDNISEVAQALVGKKSLSNLSQRDADMLSQYIALHSDDKAISKAAEGAPIFGQTMRKVVFGQRSVPVFEKADASFLESVRGIEAQGVDAIKAESDRLALEGRLEVAKKDLPQALADLEIQKGNLENVKATIEQMNGSNPELAKELITQAGASLKAAQDRVDSIQKSIQDISELSLAKAKEKGALPKLVEDNREFVPAQEIADANFDRLSEVDVSYLGTRRGYKRQEYGVANLVRGDLLKAAKKEKRILAESLRPVTSSIKALRKDIKKQMDAFRASESIMDQEDIVRSLHNAIDQKVESKMKQMKNAGTPVSEEAAREIVEAESKTMKSPAEARLKAAEAKLKSMKKRASRYDEKKLAELRVQLDDDLAKLKRESQKLSDKFNTSGYKILGNGKYLDDKGRVRDLIIRKGNGNNYSIMGNDHAKIAQAIVADMIANGSSKIKGLEPQLVGDLPQSIVGSSKGSYLVPEDVANFLDDILTPLYGSENVMVDHLLRGYDKLQNLFKVPLLAPWLSSMARNSIGNVSLVYLRAGLRMFDPEHFTDYMKILTYTLANESKGFRTALGYVGKMDSVKALGAQTIKHTGSAGLEEAGHAPMTIDELMVEFGKRGVFSAWYRDEVFEDSFGDIAAGLLGEDSKVTKVAQKIDDKAAGGAAGALIGGSVGGPIGGLVGAGLGAMLGKETYRMKNLFRFQELASEIPTRVMLAMQVYKETGSVKEAGDAVRRFLHDYSELSTFEKRFMRRAIPFYNFTKLAMKSFSSALINNPGRILQPTKIFNTQNRSALFADEEASPEDVPDWIHKQFSFMGKDIDEETGEVKTWAVTGFNLPVQEVLQLTDVVMPGGAPISQFGSRTSFLATSVAEYVLNYDTFRGGPIRPDVSAGIKQTSFESGTPFKGSPDWMKKLVGYELGDDGMARVNPKISWVLGEIPTSRFVNAAKKIYEVGEDESKRLNYTHIASQVLGANKYVYDQELQKYFVNKARVEAMSTVLSNIRALKSYDIDRSTFDDPSKGKKRKPLSAFGGGSNPFE